MERSLKDFDTSRAPQQFLERYNHIQECLSSMKYSEIDSYLSEFLVREFKRTMKKK